jgi:hypothetical protein
MDSTCYKLSNDILFVIFRNVVSKIRFFKDLAENNFENKFEFLFEPGQGHVAVCDWSIPIRTDLNCEPLDSKRSVHPRCARIDSLT